MPVVNDEVHWIFRKDLQFKDEDDILPILINLMQIDDVGVFHFGQNMYLFLYVFTSHASTGRLKPFLFDELGRVFMTGILLQHPVDRSELTTAKQEQKNIDHLTYSSSIIFDDFGRYPLPPALQSFGTSILFVSKLKPITTIFLAAALVY